MQVLNYVDTIELALRNDYSNDQLRMESLFEGLKSNRIEVGIQRKSYEKVFPRSAEYVFEIIRMFSVHLIDPKQSFSVSQVGGTHIGKS